MIRTCKIVMKRATEPVRINGPIIFEDEHGILSTVHKPRVKQVPYHLYIVSSDQIKHGDWCLVGDNVVKYDSTITTQEELEANWEKVIASSDSNLIIEEGGVTAYSNKHGYDVDAHWEIPIPNLPYYLVEQYCNSRHFEHVLVLYDGFDKPHITEDNRIIIFGFIKHWN